MRDGNDSFGGCAGAYPPYEAFSNLLFGESSTMAEEAAMQGVPAVYLFDNNTYYTKHLEVDYQLLFNYSESNEDQIKAIEKGLDLICNSEVKKACQASQQKMLTERIDVTAFLVWFIENYPESFEIMRRNPDYQYRFK